MPINTTHSLLIIAVIAVVTFLTRALPFLIFHGDKPLPKLLVYLGRVLSGATMGMLLVYCFRNTAVTTWPFALPEIIATAVVVGTYLWKKNILISVGLGTALYMVLVQVVFK